MPTNNDPTTNTNESLSIQDLVDNYQNSPELPAIEPVASSNTNTLQNILNTRSVDDISNVIVSSIDDMSQQPLFPQKLEPSGYVILSAVALIFSLFFIIQSILFRKLLVSIKEGHKTLKDMSFSLYIQQQLTEYRLLLSDLNYSINPVEKTNARTQLYNHLNTICIEICECHDKKFALQLSQIFFSKIQSRYLKLSSIPEGVVYFKYIGQFLINNPDYTLDKSVRTIRRNFKKEINIQLATEKHTHDSPTSEKPKRKFPFFNKKEKK